MTDTQIHRIELLLSLDYLMYNTDEKHPAKQLDICRYATEYGLRFDANSTSGNDVRRDRIKDCLDYLYELSNKYPDKLPVIIEKTDSGKYYAESKFYLTDEQVVKMLSAIKNDKYIDDSESDLMVESLVQTFTNKFNQSKIRKELEDVSLGVKKISRSSRQARNLALVKKAIKNNQIISLVFESVPTNEHGFAHTHETIKNFRVYKIQTIKNKPYAILLPMSGSGIESYPVSELRFANPPLFDDESRLSLDERFKRNNEFAYEYFHSLEGYIQAAKRPTSKYPIIADFVFPAKLLDRFEESFESYFSRKIDPSYIKEYEVVDVEGGKKINVLRRFEQGDDVETAFCHSVDKINFKDFVSWVISDPLVAKNITIVEPVEARQYIAEHYYQMLKQYSGDLNNHFVALFDNKVENN